MEDEIPALDIVVGRSEKNECRKVLSVQTKKPRTAHTPKHSNYKMSANGRYRCLFDGCKDPHDIDSFKKLQMQFSSVQQDNCTGMYFKTKYQFWRHVNEVHSVQENLIYSCSFCDQKYALLGMKDYHEVHKHIKPHACKYCGRKFGLKSSKAKHERVHTAENHDNSENCELIENNKKTALPQPKIDLNCQICNKGGFTAERLLKSHIKTVHLKIREYACTAAGCHYRASSKGNLDKHSDALHGKIISLDDCRRKKPRNQTSVKTVSNQLPCSSNLMDAYPQNFNKDINPTSLDLEHLLSSLETKNGLEEIVQIEQSSSKLDICSQTDDANISIQLHDTVASMEDYQYTVTIDPNSANFYYNLLPMEFEMQNQSIVVPGEQYSAQTNDCNQSNTEQVSNQLVNTLTSVEDYSQNISQDSYPANLGLHNMPSVVEMLNTYEIIPVEQSNSFWQSFSQIDFGNSANPLHASAKSVEDLLNIGMDVNRTDLGSDYIPSAFEVLETSEVEKAAQTNSYSNDGTQTDVSSLSHQQIRSATSKDFALNSIESGAT